ncbi:MAG: ATP-binding cassette domain-containing protein [Trueperaceae bacterium]|nr:ATP-binding cassette domain-containing protein [Trueperaceae bacterium]
MIELQGISKRFGGVSVLDSVDLVVGPGSYIALSGPSGAGKTTLLGILGLLESPSSGMYRFQGESTITLRDGQLAGLRNRAFGFVFQQFSLIPGLNAWQNVARPLMFARVPRSEQKRRALELLEQVGLAYRANHRPAQLSGGEQQRVAIARALINDPDILLADEPTGNLPIEQWEPILNAFDKLNEAGKTILLVTHNPDVAERASRVLWLRGGRLEEASRTLSPAWVGVSEGVGEGASIASAQSLVEAAAEPSRVDVDIELLGRVRLKVNGRETQIQPRQAEILAVLAANPKGLSGEQLLLLVYGDEGNASTLKAALSKLRRTVPIASYPYRLLADVAADFIRLEAAVRAGRIDQAVGLYSGPLLPQSDSPGVVELRETLDSALRHAVLNSGDGGLALQLAEVLGNDLELWETASSRLDASDPRRAIALAGAEAARKNWR